MICNRSSCHSQRKWPGEVVQQIYGKALECDQSWALCSVIGALLCAQHSFLDTHITTFLPASFVMLENDCSGYNSAFLSPGSSFISSVPLLISSSGSASQAVAGTSPILHQGCHGWRWSQLECFFNSSRLLTASLWRCRRPRKCD